jgi:O-antigen/teichoic acid export membrane protein
MQNVKNSAYGVISALVFPVLMLFATPVLLNSLGVEGYAMWILVNSVVASLAVVNFGGGDIIIKFISSGKGGGDANTSEEVFGTVFILQLLATLTIYLLFVIVAPFATQYIVSDNLLTFVNILYFAIPVFFVKQLEDLLYSFLSGHEQFGYGTALSSISNILFISAQIIIAIFTQSVEDIFFGALIVSVLLFLPQFVYIKTMYKDGISFNKANFGTAKSLLSFGGWNWMSSLASIPKGHSDKWLISGLLGLQTFGIYSIGLLVFNQLHTIMGSSIWWIFPGISKDSSNKKSLVKKYWKLTFYIGTISLFSSIILTNLDFLFEIWLGKEFYKDSQYYINTFLLIFPVFTINLVFHVYFLGLGLVKHKFFTEVASLAVKVVTIWLVVDVFNIKEWVLFFMVFIAIEYIIYSAILSKNLPIKFIHLIAFLLLQVAIVFARI